MEPEMKTWIKRTLIGLTAGTLLFGGLAAAYAHRQAQHYFGWRTVSEADAAPIKATVLERVGSRLELDANQKAKLGVLADRLRESRNAVVSASADPKSELQAVIAGNAFDRARASQLVQAQLTTLNAQSPALITAMADFYDSLNPAQQAQLREFLSKRGRHGGGERHGRG
jgi:periplasmic protein CpxP/Spy